MAASKGVMTNWLPTDALEEAKNAAPTPPNGRAKEPIELLPIDPATLAAIPIPERQWLVPDWIPMAGATSLYGAGGEGKTLVAQMLATACSLDGVKWLGLPVRKCNTLLLFCEDDRDEMHRRQADINNHYGCSFADLGAMRWLPRLGEDNALMTFNSGRAHEARLFSQLLEVARAHDAKLIITDTLADIFIGQENDRGQARLFVQSILGHLARATGAASLTLAHPSLTGSANGTTGSGSTGWVGTFRSQLYFETPKPEEGEQPDPDIRILRRAKANYASRNDIIEVKWQAGAFVPLHAPTGIIGSIEKRSCERVFLDLLDATTAENQPVSSNSKSGNYAPRLFAKRPKANRQSFKAADFAYAMQTLFAKIPPEIINQPYGRKGDERTRLVRNLDEAQGE